MFRISNLLKDRKALKVVTPHKKKKHSVIQFENMCLCLRKVERSQICKRQVERIFVVEIRQ